MITEIHHKESAAIFKMYRDERMTAGQIAKKLSVSRAQVAAIIKEVEQDVNAPTEEWQEKNGWNAKKDGNGKLIGRSLPTRADWLRYVAQAINEQQQLAAIQLMTLYVRSGAVMRAIDYDISGGRSMERDTDQQDHYDLLIEIGRKIGLKAWTVLQEEIIAELRQHQPDYNYSREIPTERRKQELQVVLDKVDSCLYEFRSKEIEAAYF